MSTMPMTAAASTSTMTATMTTARPTGKFFFYRQKSFVGELVREKENQFCSMKASCFVVVIVAQVVVVHFVVVAIVVVDRAVVIAVV